MADFIHATPAQRIVYGVDALERMQGELRRAGHSRVVILCGRTLADAPAGLPRLRGALGSMLVDVYPYVQPYSPVASVEAVTDFLRQARPDAVVALGGGSAVVTARAASILLAEGRPVRELVSRFASDGTPESPKLLASKLPQYVIPTTPTTACAKVGSGIVDPDMGRITMFDPKTRAKVLFVDTALAAETPSALVLDAALNAFVMAVQGLESKAGDPLSDAMLIHSLRLFRDNLPLIATASDGPEVRGKLIMGAILCGQGTEYTQGGLASVLAHSIGATMHRAHGMTSAVVLPYTMRFNAPATAGRLTLVNELFGKRASDSSNDAAEACADFLHSLGVPNSLLELGIESNSFGQIAEAARRDWFLYQNPHPITNPVAAVTSILNAAAP
jgi:alcohol dehydrogenase class IV